MSGGSPHAGAVNRVSPAAPRWAVRDSGATVPAGWASRAGDKAVSSLAVPTGDSIRRAWPVLAAAAPQPDSPLANESRTQQQRELMRVVHSPLASVMSAFGQLHGRVMGVAAAVLPPGCSWSRFDTGAPGLHKCSNNGTTTTTSPAVLPTARPFASVMGAHAPSLPFASGASPGSTTAPAAVAAAAAAKAEVGRATWTLLHTLAAQFPDRPSRQQQRDARTLVDCLTRIYPCGDCARHFAELIKRDPPVVSSGPAFRRWLCGVHNRVNARLGKPTFNCDVVEARWAPLGCSAAEAAAGEGMLPDGEGAAEAGCELLGVGSKGPQRRRG